MKKTQTSTTTGERATTCRSLAIKAEKRAAQTQDPDVRTSFLSMKELWLDLAKEIDRRQSGNSAGNQPQ